MFPSVRQTRRSQSKSHRKTLKVQQGGAAWTNINNLANWAPALARFPFTRDNRKARPVDNAERTAIMKEWFQIIEFQDVLFASVVDIILQQLGLPNKSLLTSKHITDSIDAINARKADFMVYIRDVENLVNFNIINIGIGHNRLDYTKLEDIRNLPSETLASLLIFPQRLSNIFINSLATIFVALNADNYILTQLVDAAGRRSLDAVELLAEQYESNVKGNALLQTARPLRDGFFLGQPKEEINHELYNDEESGPFFRELIELIYEMRNYTRDNIFREVTDGTNQIVNLKQYSWARIAAHVFLAYTFFGKNKDILDFFTEPFPEQPPTNEDEHRTYTPNDEFLNIPVRGTTLAILKTWMEIKQLHFILHLYKTIKIKEELEHAQTELENAQTATHVAESIVSSAGAIRNIKRPSYEENIV